MGRLHDIGKMSAQFQAYIRRVADQAGGEAHGRGGDHSTAGARVARDTYGDFGTLLAYGIAGHHAGLDDWTHGLDRRLDRTRTVLPDLRGWQDHADPLLALASLLSESWKKGPHRGFSHAFLARMLFSCLVDADSVETARFYREYVPPCFAPLSALLDTARAWQANRAPPHSDVDRLRAEVLDHAEARAALPPGLFTFTVPTGGGKTLSALRFALEHARAHGMRRVVFVAPYTSVIEQTAAVFRGVLGDADVLEHHASFDWEAARRASDDADDAAADPVGRLRRAADDWDAPVIVTTAVQFFESLFAARRARCRKLHNLARAVIVLDEAQTLPLTLLQPCLAALDELARNYGASLVLCTATQPAIRVQDGFPGGLHLPPSRELAPDPEALYSRLRRVTVKHLVEPVDEATLVAAFAASPRMLCIVNRRDHAAALFARIREMDGALHLSTLMCPRHRRAVLEQVRTRLHPDMNLPVRLVATSLMEAGVDVDFPEVWREIAGLDQIAQAAGRCNREGRRDTGRVVVFTRAEQQPPDFLKQQVKATASVLRRFAADPLSLKAVRSYFADLYWHKGPDAFDTAKVGERPGILAAIGERADTLRFPFAQIADAFRMIDDAMDPVIVPWAGEDGTDPGIGRLLARIAAMDKPLRDDLRQLQQYTVTVPPRLREEWLAKGVVRPVSHWLGDALVQIDPASMATLYDNATGLVVTDALAQTQF